MRDLWAAGLSALGVAAVATVGDYVWASQLLSHRMTYGLVHGAALCLSMGLAVGLPAGKPLTGAVGGLIVGFMAAAFFYLLAPLLGYSAMFAAWILLWLLLAFLDGPLLHGTPRSAVVIRGALAAALSGAAFYAVSGMWTNWNPQQINYADHFLRWTVALLPGFLALRLAPGGRRSR